MELSCSNALVLSKNLQKHYFILDSNRLNNRRQSKIIRIILVKEWQTPKTQNWNSKKKKK